MDQMPNDENLKRLPAPRDIRALIDHPIGWLF